MKKLKNKLSWSSSRQGKIDNCLRLYYLHHYGSWEGWLGESMADPKRRLYVLKNLTNQWGWKGIVFHDAMEHFLKASQHEVIPKNRIFAWINKTMRKQWTQSLKKSIRNDPKNNVTLEEHWNGRNGFDSVDYRDQFIEEVQQWFHNFYFSNMCHAMLDRKAQWKSIEQMNTFMIDKVDIWVKMDFVWASEKVPYLIVDWKTGKRKKADKNQLALYALYALDTHDDLTPKDIRVMDVYVKEGSNEYEQYPRFITTSLSKVRFDVKKKIIHMKTLLLDVENNVPKTIEEFPMVSTTASAPPCRWCKFKEVCHG